MLDVILQILAAVGTGLCVLLLTAFFLLLLALFFPVTYRAFGSARGKEVRACFQAAWLFGLLRLRYAYPAEGENKVKFLWMTIADLSGGGKEKKDGATPRAGEKGSARPDGRGQDNAGPKKAEPEGAREDASGREKTYHQGAREGPLGENSPEKARKEAKETAEKDPQKEGQENLKASEKKHKPSGAAGGVYDKMKEIWQTISYYAALLQERESRALLEYVKRRLLRLLRSIRPRKFKARVRFGTGSPDTTGYVFGVYGMLTPFLGPGVSVQPDFEQAALEGEFSAAGRLTAAAFVTNILAVLLDKRLWRVKNKLSAGARERGKEGKNGR